MKPQTGFRIHLISALAAAAGIVAGFAAWGLYALISLLTNLVFFQRAGSTLPGLQAHGLGAWIILVPAAGGLIVGLMARYGSPQIRGHGIPEVMEAVLRRRSRIAPRVAVLKPLSAAIAIGTGGPFGAEGPIIQTGGALGSLLGQVIHMTAAERKVLLGCGAAAGMAATFNTPIAAVVFAIELLLFEFRSRSFIPLVIATTLATTVHFRLMGRSPMFVVSPMQFGIPSAIPYYLLLGLLCGLAAVAFSKSLYAVEAAFEKLPFDALWWPALGGIGVGVIALGFPRVLGVGYDTITDILDDRLALSALAGVLVFKSLALLLSLGSGTSGGLLAPMFMAGAALGGSFAMVVDRLVPGAHLSPAACALVGMAALFGAASRATFTFIIFAFEITRDYDAILPLMLVCVIADGVGLLLMPTSIMTEKLARRGVRVPQEFEADVFQQVTVGEVMARGPVALDAGTTIGDLSDRIARGDPAVAGYQAFPILSETGALCGIVTRGDLLRALERGMEASRSVLEAGTEDPVVAHPDEPLHDAIERMLRHDVGRLPVVSRNDGGRLIGYLGRAAILQARAHRLDEEHVREPGWLPAALAVGRPTGQVPGSPRS